MAEYAFVLDPVSVERNDVLESKLRDQQDELKRLREDFDAGQVVSYIQLEATSSKSTTSNLLWSDTESDNFSVIEKLVRCQFADLVFTALPQW